MTSEPKRPHSSGKQASPPVLGASMPSADTPGASASEPDVNPASLASLGIQFAVALIAAGYAGQWLDRRFNSAPIFLMIGVFFGGGGTFYLSYKRLMAPRPPQ